MPLTAPPKSADPAPPSPSKAAEPAATPEETISFSCPQCDEKVQVAASLESKQTPCPNCRRIVKVPLRVRQEPKDWRRITPEVEAPAAAPPALAAAMATPGLAAALTRPAPTEEAEEPEAAEPVPASRRLLRGSLLAAGLLLIAWLGWHGWTWWSFRQQEQFILRATELVEGQDGLPPEASGQVFRAAGDFYLRAGRVADARGYFARARALLADGKTSERDAALIDLALSQANLGGSADQVEAGTRLSEAEAQGELRQTLQMIQLADARFEALRQLAPLLIRRGESATLVMLAAQAPPHESAEALALVGLELLRQGDREAATRLANQALERYALATAPPPPPEPMEPQPPAEEKPADPPPPPPPPPRVSAAALFALWFALGRQDELGQQKLHVIDRALWNAGYAQALALEGKPDEARQLVLTLPPGSDRLNALAGIAAAGLEAPTQPLGAFDDAAAIASQERLRLSDSWPLLRLVRLALAAGRLEQARQIADAILDPVLHGRARLEILRARLASSTETPDDTWIEIEEKAPARYVAREAVARRAAALGGPAASMVESWPAEMQPFGYAGIALARQCRRAADPYQVSTLSRFE
jgi:hypothetical protein